MKMLWARMLKRLEVMTVRERLLLITCVVALLSAITDAAFITPLYKQQRLLAQQIDRQSALKDAQSERLQLELLKRRLERATEINASMGKLQREIDAVEGEISVVSNTGSAPVALPAVLARVLKRTAKVALVRVVSAGADNGAAVSTGAGRTLRSGMEITLAGNYLDLMEYLAALEKALPQVRWNGIALSTASSPPQVTMHITTPPGGS